MRFYSKKFKKHSEITFRPISSTISSNFFSLRDSSNCESARFDPSFCSQRLDSKFSSSLVPLASIQQLHHQLERLVRRRRSDGLFQFRIRDFRLHLEAVFQADPLRVHAGRVGLEHLQGECERDCFLSCTKSCRYNLIRAQVT